MWFLLVIVIAEISAEPCVNVLFSPHKKIFEYIHDKPLIYHLNNLTDNVLQKCFLVVYVVRYTDIF